MSKIDIKKVDALRNAFNAMHVSHEQINVGDIVTIHPANTGFFRFPTVERPGIVTEFLPRAFRGYEEDAGTNTPGAAMLFDCVVHIIDEEEDDDGNRDVIPFLMDSRRLVKVN
jgi:hypothetical protein